MIMLPVHYLQNTCVLSEEMEYLHPAPAASGVLLREDVTRFQADLVIRLGRVKNEP
jgi:hypothetical protein